MNDLFLSDSFKRYKDLEHQVCIDDMQAGGEAWKETVNLDGFFKEIENVKYDMRAVVQLYKRLQEANEESKLIHDAKSMKELTARMDSDVEQVLKLVKIIKGKLETLELSNADQRKLPGCGAGSSSDRTRTSVLNGLAKKLKDMMDDFQGLRTKMGSEYKETDQRRYFTITGEKANEEMIENLISSGASETLLPKAIEEQGRGQVLDTVQEIEERHDAVKEMEKSLIELHQVFLDMAVLCGSVNQLRVKNKQLLAGEKLNKIINKRTPRFILVRQLPTSSLETTEYSTIINGNNTIVFTTQFPKDPNTPNLTHSQ